MICFITCSLLIIVGLIWLNVEITQLRKRQETLNENYDKVLSIVGDKVKELSASHTYCPGDVVVFTPENKNGDEQDHLFHIKYVKILNSKWVYCGYLLWTKEADPEKWNKLDHTLEFWTTIINVPEEHIKPLPDMSMRKFQERK